MRVLHARQHRHLIVHHRLVALDALLQDDLDGALALWPIGLAHDAIGAGAQRATEAILGPRAVISKRSEPDSGLERTSSRSYSAARQAYASWRTLLESLEDPVLTF